MPAEPVIRSKIESLRFEKDAAVQQTVQRSTDEIEQLRETASNLRERLETQKLDYEAMLQQQDKNNLDEKLHLQKTIENLRSKLEKENA